VGSPLPAQSLADNGIVKGTGTTVSFVENLDSDQIASLLSALEERAVRTRGLRVEDASWRPDSAEWQALRLKVIERDGERCAVPGCDRSDELHLDHVWARIVARSDRLVSLGDK